MFQTSILDVMIGLFFVYAVLSLVCSAITELIAQVSAMRAKTLKKGIERLLGDAKINNKSLVDTFYDHHLIAALSKNGNPSYIPSRTVALTLLNLIKPEGNTDEEKMNSLREKLRNFGGEDTPVAQALSALFDQAGNSLEKGVANVEHWVDDQMDRVSGWYRRWSRWVLLIVGLVVCVIVNADTLKIVAHLYNDPVYRNQIVAIAESWISEKEKQAGADADGADAADAAESLKKAFDLLREELTNVQPLVGWSSAEVKKIGTFGWWLGKITGLIVTAFAISLGAPFWFNALQKLLQIRGSVKPKKEASG